VELYIAPKKGRTHILRLIREILFYEPQGRKTDLAKPLDFLNRVTIRRAVVFVISDFQADGYEKALTICSRRHDLIAVVIEDPKERSIPTIGPARVEDPETGAVFEIDFSNPGVRAEFARQSELERNKSEALFRSKQIDSIILQTDRDYFPALRSFFLRRESRLRAR
jgi:uncharacterized protein (DUF58 family)